MNVLLVGEESAGIHTLKALARSRHRVVGVLAAPRPRYGSGVTLRNTAEQLGYCTWPAELVRDGDFAARVRALEVDLLLNVHSLYVIAEEVLDAPRVGAFNLHPGPLPRYAGLNAVSWAIYRGETTHGVTLHQMVPAIDAGDIYYQTLFPLGATATALSVSLRCIQEGLTLIARLLDDAQRSPTALPCRPQDLKNREYFGRAIPQQGQLCWSLSAREIVNFVRACDYHPFRSPWGHPRTWTADQELRVVKAARTGLRTDEPPGSVGSADGTGRRVASADEWVLVTKIEVDGVVRDASTVLQPGERLEDGEREREKE